jgi:hypothetical protein
MAVPFGDQILLPFDPSNALHAATKQYVDSGLAAKADTPALAGKQDVDPDLTAFAALTPSAGQSIVWNGSAWVAGAPTGVAWSDRVETLADSATLSPNALSGLIQSGVCTALNQDATLNAPTNGSQAQPYTAIIKANTAARTISFASFTPTGDWGTTSYQIASGKWGIFTFRYISAIGWVIAGKLQTV